MVEPLYAILGYLMRAFIGLGLSVALALAGVIGGLGIYIFSGSYDWGPRFWLMMTGAGMGAALGAYLGWLTIGPPKPTSATFAMFLIIAGLGITGAWVGYNWGADQETACCALPKTSSTTYTVTGAIIAANISSALLGVFSQLRWRLPTPPPLDQGLSRGSQVTTAR